MSGGVSGGVLLTFMIIGPGTNEALKKFYCIRFGLKSLINAKNKMKENNILEVREWK